MLGQARFSERAANQILTALSSPTDSVPRTDLAPRTAKTRRGTQGTASSLRLHVAVDGVTTAGGLPKETLQLVTLCCEPSRRECRQLLSTHRDPQFGKRVPTRRTQNKQFARPPAHGHISS